jgi:hypothetical protein
VFSLLLDVGKIDPDVVANMRDWKHSGFSVDMSVRIEAGDHSGMQRLVEYISRCPFSLARMVSVTNDGKILYRAGKAECIPFPKTGDKDLSSGMRRNYEVYDPLDFLAEVTQHIPNKGEHQIRYYGQYSNKKRGMAEKTKKSVVPALPGMPEPDTTYRRKCRMTWAALIKCVYEVDPLKCPPRIQPDVRLNEQPRVRLHVVPGANCGGEMKIVAFIEEKMVIEQILRHCQLWNDHKPHPPPKPPPNQLIPPATVERSILDFDFFERNCA